MHRSLALLLSYGVACLVGSSGCDGSVGATNVDASTTDPVHGSDAGALRDAGVHDSRMDGGLRDAGLGQTDAASARDAAPPLVAGCSKEHTSGREMLSFEVDGVAREVLIYVPRGYSGDTPLPLTFNLHGTSGNPAGHEDATGIEPVADAKGFIIAALAGYQGRWNVARSPDQPDDVAFAEVVLDWAAENLCIDPGRVFSTGFSGGARTSSRFACAMPDRIRAIAPVAGVRHDPPCDVSGIPVLTLHGTGDQTNFYNGCNETDTACSRNGEWVESVEAAITDWRWANGCAESYAVERITDKIERRTWTGCSSGADVVFYRVVDGTHVWQLLPNTAEVVLDFFSRVAPGSTAAR
jgi:polyhydroxybutyrate depolymerase